MKVSNRELVQIVREELAAVLQEKGLQTEHRGKKCADKHGIERLECEKKAQEAKDRNMENTRKKREYAANDEELEALQRAKVYNMKPKHRTRRDEIKPMESINPKLHEKKYKKKKHCQSGNKWHDKDGEFTTKSKATSWSGSNPGNKENCTYGWSRSKGKGERLATKLMCGREGGKQGKPDPNKKATYKCKDGKKHWEKSLKEVLMSAGEEVLDAGNFYIIRKDVFDDLLNQNTQNLLSNLELRMQKELMEQQVPDSDHKRCMALGYRSFEHFIKSINQIQLASQGKLLEPPKREK